MINTLRYFQSDKLVLCLRIRSMTAVAFAKIVRGQ